MILEEVEGRTLIPPNKYFRNAASRDDFRLRDTRGICGPNIEAIGRVSLEIEGWVWGDEHAYRRVRGCFFRRFRCSLGDVDATGGGAGDDGRLAPAIRVWRRRMGWK
jgi:hypothetical protein